MISRPYWSSIIKRARRIAAKQSDSDPLQCLCIEFTTQLHLLLCAAHKIQTSINILLLFSLGPNRYGTHSLLHLNVGWGGLLLDLLIGSNIATQVTFVVQGSPRYNMLHGEAASMIPTLTGEKFNTWTQSKIIKIIRSCWILLSNMPNRSHLLLVPPELSRNFRYVPMGTNVADCRSTQSRLNHCLEH